MPTYQYEAMDNTGLEIKDTIDAQSEAEAQTMIGEKGFFVTKIAEKGRRGKKDKTTAETKTAAKTGPRKRRAFSIGGVRAKQLCLFTRQLSTLQDGWIVAYNDETLEELWRFNVGTPLKGAPVTYAIGPKQYLAVQAGGRHLHPVNWDKLENSSYLFVFALN